MPSEPVERKLVAVLSADVVGYGRLMADDEMETVKTLKAHKGLMGRLIRQHAGRVVDDVGDDLMAEFASVVDAVACGVAIQNDLAERNEPVSDRRCMRFRIGINLGDVIVEADRIYGDGVNIAARVQALAEEGGVSISGTAFDHVEGKLGLQFEDLGPQKVKNIPKPVRVYRVQVSAANETEASLTVPGFSGHPAIAVLPFANLSGDPEQEYFVDGVVEDLISRLSHQRWFPVIARNSSFTYKGKPVDVKQVSRELGVRYVVEGSIRKASNRVRISVQLIDATSAHHVWAERYDRQIQDVFAIQDEIADEVVRSIVPVLWRSEWKRTVRQRPQNLDAWDAYARGSWHFHQFTKSDNISARSLFERAIELDPNFARAIANLSDVYQTEIINQWCESPAESLRKAEQTSRRAVALDGTDPLCWSVLGGVLMLTGQHGEAISAFQCALEFDPSSAGGLYNLGLALALRGKPEEAIPKIETAIRLSPENPLMHLFCWAMSLAQANANRNEEAIEWARKSLRLRSDNPLASLVLAGSNAALGRVEHAQAAVEDLLRVNPSFSLSGVEVMLSGSHPAYVEKVISRLRSAGLPE